MVFVDVHAHLQDKKFEDKAEIVGNAIKNGVKVIINNGLELESNKETLELARKFPMVKAALGLYPMEALKLKP